LALDDTPDDTEKQSEKPPDLTKVSKVIVDSVLDDNHPEAPPKVVLEQQMELALAIPPEEQQVRPNKHCPDPPDAPPAVRIHWEPLMENHFDSPKEMTTFYFMVEDNVGKGDYFYESILNSSIFQQKFGEYGTDVERLRTCLKNYALINTGFSKAIFEYYNGPDVKIDYAIRNLQYLFASKKMYPMTEWVFESLSGNKEFLESIGKKRILAKTVHSTTKKLYEDDKEYCNVLVTFFDQEVINKMSYFQWIRDIGTMGQYAGDSEMLLFVHCFNTHIIVVKNTWDGIQIENTGIYVERIKDPTDKDQVFPKPSFDDSIFIWSVNPEAPSHPLKPDKYLTQHFITLNLTSEPDPSKEHDILTFERVPWKQD
jgi:hypothetical protein